MTGGVLTESAQRAQVVAEGFTWLHTPYHHHGRVKGPQGGVDCLMLLAEVFERCGLVGRVEPGSYAHDWHLHRDEETYMQGLGRYTRRLRRDEWPQIGDIALFRFGRTFSHAGIVAESRAGGRLGDMVVLHSYHDRGVIASRLGEEPLDGRAVTFWSLW
jgi:cell wall-associated NlpC family hydrolase